MSAYFILHEDMLCEKQNVAYRRERLKKSLEEFKREQEEYHKTLERFHRKEKELAAMSRKTPQLATR